MHAWLGGLNIEHYKIVYDLYRFVELEYQKNCYFCKSSMLTNLSPNIYKRIHELDEELRQANSLQGLIDTAEKLKANWLRMFQRFNGEYPQRRLPSSAKASVAVRFFPSEFPSEFVTLQITDTNPDMVIIVERHDLTRAEIHECLERQPQLQWPFWQPQRVRGIATEPGVAQLDPALVAYLKGPSPSSTAAPRSYAYVDEAGDAVRVPTDDEIFGDDDPPKAAVDKPKRTPQTHSSPSHDDDITHGQAPSDSEIFDLLE